MSIALDFSRTKFQTEQLAGKMLQNKKGVFIVDGRRLLCDCGNDVFYYHLMIFTTDGDKDTYKTGGFIQYVKCGALYNAPEKYDEMVTA